MRPVSRRGFLARIGILGGGGVAAPFLPGSLKSPLAAVGGGSADTMSRIVRVHHPGATDGSGGKDNEHLVEPVVQEMVGEGVKAFSGRSSVIAAWEDVIPDPTRRVAIKVNCQITGIYTKSKVVKGITDGLIARGVPADNIVIYDRTDTAFGYAGFVKNTGAGIKVGKVDELGGFSSAAGLFGMAKLISGESGSYDCDYLINVPCLKALDGYSGVTLSMKNHYGTCTPNHSDIMNRIPLYSSLPQIRDKTRLIVLDGIFCEYKWFNGRGQANVDITNRLLFATDPVAMDYVGWQMIESLREAHGLPAVDPSPDFIHNAAADYGLGTDDPSRMEIIDIHLGGVTTRGAVDRKIHDLKQGTATDAEVKETIRKYMEGK